MSVYPVIMCGGSGTRLWPASRQNRPKQFIPLVGDRSSFQNTVLRVAQIDGAEAPIIVAGVGHADHLRAQLDELGVEAQIILEPEARDSAPAMAGAAAWIAARDPGGLAVFVSADHHIPDSKAFAEAVGSALTGAREGRIVTLGLKPTYPSTAFGYIQPGSGDAATRPVTAFVEKPDHATASAYLEQGFLWNSGNFITAASTLLAELDRHAPEVSAMARAAVASAVGDDAVLLGDAFRAAPKISIDYAVMEKTDLASVTPSAFEWMDIGAWDAVFSALPKDAQGNAGDALFIDAYGNLVRSPLTTQVALVGVSNLAVIIEDGAVLVADLARAQKVKQAGETFKSAPAPAAFQSLQDGLAWFEGWMTTSVLPLWMTLGADLERGGFREVLAWEGPQPPRRARVQPRQAWSFATAGALGWQGDWRGASQNALDCFEAHYRRPDGLFRTLAAADGQALNEDAFLYDQAFAMLAWSTTGDEDKALALLSRLEARRHAAGGWRESGPHPFASNPHMHLFEAALAWVVQGKSPTWTALADDIATLALERFIDETGALQEVFDADWRPAHTDGVSTFEPGHQFEWAFLLKTWGDLRDRDASAQTARLYQLGLTGLDPARQVVVDVVDSVTPGPQHTQARFWPQTEFFRASLAFGHEAHALAALNAMHRYRSPEIIGAWRDKMAPSGILLDEPAPASTLYHLVGAWQAARAFRR